VKLVRWAAYIIERSPITIAAAEAQIRRAFTGEVQSVEGDSGRHPSRCRWHVTLCGRENNLE
jgi:hypothetical protein